MRRGGFTMNSAETEMTRLRQTVREGNVLRIWIKDEGGRTLIEIPEVLGVRGGFGCGRSGPPSARWRPCQGR